MRSSIQDSVKKLSTLGLASELQTEILRHLIDGRRSITELVQLIFHTSKDDQAFDAEYMKVTRAIRKLENKGLVATRIFGRDKPYRLTSHAIETLYYRGRPGESSQLVSIKDLAIYSSTLIAGAATLSLIWGLDPSTRARWVALSSGAFLYLLGVSSCRIVNLMRRVL